MSGTWFDKLSSEAQADYCGKLKGGKKKSKFCNIETGRPLLSTEREPSKPKNTAPKTRPSNPGSSEAPSGSAEVSKDDAYYDVKGDHTWAKKAEIKNLGEDIKGSARHRKNAHRDWGDLGAMSENKDFTKKELLKLHEINSEDIPAGHEIPFWVIKDIMSKYPDEKGLTTEDKKVWIEKYQLYLAEGKKIATENKDPIVTAALFTAYLDNEGLQLGRVARGEVAVRYFARNAKRDTFYKASGAIQKLEGLVPQEKLRGVYRSEEKFKVMTDHIESMDISGKIKEVIDGKPFLSTITGQKATVDRFDEASVYKEIIMGRHGDNIFDSADESGVFLNETVGFKGIQFGNSLPDNERADHLGHASHAFHDMAEALNISPKNISMNGEVSLGFGSRGVAGSLATYFPGTKFINLNRHNGYGALAHEWGHAYGFNISEKILAKKNIKSSIKCCFSELNPAILHGSDLEPVFKRTKAIEAKVRERFRASPEYRACSNSRKKWLWESAEIFARAFETYTAKKMESKGKSNTYLVSNIKSFGWPTDDEMKEYEGIFDDLLKKTETF